LKLNFRDVHDFGDPARDALCELLPATKLVAHVDDGVMAARDITLSASASPQMENADTDVGSIGAGEGRWNARLAAGLSAGAGREALFSKMASSLACSMPSSQSSGMASSRPGAGLRR
jgi:hypothetical protein